MAMNKDGKFPSSCQKILLNEQNILGKNMSRFQIFPQSWVVSILYFFADQNHIVRIPSILAQISTETIVWYLKHCCDIVINFLVDGRDFQSSQTWKNVGGLEKMA